MNHWNRQLKDFVKEKCKGMLTISVDIKGSDYIAKYYKEEQLFFSVNHPQTKLIALCANRILKFLNLDEIRLDYHMLDMCAGNLRVSGIPIYPCVVAALKLKQYYSFCYSSETVQFGRPYNLEDYVYKYVRELQLGN